MEWMRCNKCYRLMNQSMNRFIMTQCGHIFCEPCLSRATTKCHECGTIEFTTLTLEKPPKLEAMINYFSPVADFIQLSLKAIEFHEEQLHIFFRGFEQLVTKYKNLKVLYSKITENMKVLSINLTKLRADREKLDREMKIRLDQRRAKMKRPSHEGKTMKIDFPSEQKTSQRFTNSQASQSSQNVPDKFFMYPARSQSPRRPSSSDNRKRPSPSTPEYYRSNPSPPFSNNSWTSRKSSTDSGTGTAIVSPNMAFSNNSWTTPISSIGCQTGTVTTAPRQEFSNNGSTPLNSSIGCGTGTVIIAPRQEFSNNNWTPLNSSIGSETGMLIATAVHRQGDFLVPNIQKVPKSVATLQKNKQTFKRVLEHPKSRNNS